MSIESEKQKMYPEDFFMTENQKKIRQRKILISKKVSELRKTHRNFSPAKIASMIESDEEFQREFPGTCYMTIYLDCRREMPDYKLIIEDRTALICKMASELREEDPTLNARKIAKKIEADEAFQREFPDTSFPTIYKVCLQEMRGVNVTKDKTALICQMASELHKKYPHFKTSDIARSIESDEEFIRKYPKASYMTIYQTCRNAGF